MIVLFLLETLGFAVLLIVDTKRDSLVLFPVKFLIKHRESYTIVVALILERDRPFFPFKYTGVADKSLYIYNRDNVGYIKVKKSGQLFKNFHAAW